VLLLTLIMAILSLLWTLMLTLFMLAVVTRMQVSPEMRQSTY
jgi:hypothetical protein